MGKVVMLDYCECKKSLLMLWLLFIQSKAVLGVDNPKVIRPLLLAEILFLWLVPFLTISTQYLRDSG